MVRELDFFDGFISPTPPASSPAATITGSSDAPVTIATTISPQSVASEDIFVIGAPGGTTLGSNQITNPDPVFDGQILNLIGTSNGSWLELSNGGTLQLNGPARLTDEAFLSLRYDAAANLWTERYRNGMA